MNNCHEDRKARSVVKAITWKLTAVIISFIVGYYVTGSTKVSAEITGIAAVVGIVVYYIHERIWNKITWGREIIKK